MRGLGITELGDNKVMKQAIDNAFFEVHAERNRLWSRPCPKTT